MHVCQRCGKENQDHYRFCLGCGGEIGDDAPAAPARSLPSLGGEDELDPMASTAMANPPRDEETDPAPTSVNNAPVAPMGPVNTAPGPEPGKRPCPNCGNILPAGFVFCGQCGARIEATAAPAAVSPRAVASAGAARGKLVLIRPDGSEGGTHPLNAGTNLIGRGQGALFDADSYLSPRHAELVLGPGGMTVRDKDSLNGVFVRIGEEEEISDGEVFRLGQELLRFDVIHAPQPLDDGTEVMGSPNPGYWGRVALIVGKDQDGSAFPLFGDAVVLGRERGDILFPEDGYVSGTHGRLSYRGGRFYLADLNSSNGTFLRIRAARQIPSGTFLLMGQQLFRVQYS
jgi:pSer/pThr/pTyr-binding forkhead associated (FHA) protein